MSDMTELLRAHLAHLRRLNSRPDTLRDRRDNILRWERWLLEQRVTDDQGGLPSHRRVTEDVILRWQDEIAARVSASSQSTYVSNLKTFYVWAHEYGHLPTNPAARIRRPRLPEQRPRPVPLVAFRTALRTSHGDLQAMLILAGYLGLRVGEIARLRREDLQHEPGGTFLTIRGKGGKIRVLPLPQVLETMLSPWLIGRSGPVFLGPTGRQLRPGEVTYAVSTHFQGLGMPWTAHTLRHRAATRLLQLTKDVRLVQRILGHSSLNTTALYLEVTPEYAMESMGLLGSELDADLGRTPPPPLPENPGPAGGLAAA